MTRTVTLADATLSAVLGGGYAPALEDRLFIITNGDGDAIQGEFADLANGDTVNLGTHTAKISYFGDSVGGTIDLGNDVVLHSFAPVPEPGAALVVAAFGCLVFRLRRVVRRR